MAATRIYGYTRGTDGAFRHTQNDFRRPGHPSDAFEACLLPKDRDRDTPHVSPPLNGGQQRILALASDRQDSCKRLLPRRSKIRDRETSLTRLEIIARRNIGKRGKTDIEGEEEREAGLDTSKRVHPDLELGAPSNTLLGTPSNSKRELFEWQEKLLEKK